MKKYLMIVAVLFGQLCAMEDMTNLSETLPVDLSLTAAYISEEHFEIPNLAEITGVSDLEAAKAIWRNQQGVVRRILFFNAEMYGEKLVICRWETASEVNNDYFDVEAARDRNGEIVFEKIGRVSGSGTSSQNHSYSFIDENPAPGKNYYRLRQVDYDGTEFLSKAVVVLFNSEKKFDVLAVSPNPFVANPLLYLQTKQSGPMNIEVENSIGQVVFKQEVSLSRGGSTVMLELPAELSRGFYLVRMNFDGEQQVTRLLKQ